MRVTTEVHGGDPLWFAVDADHAHLLSDRADHVAVTLLLPAMKAGRDLRIGGRMTDVLLHQMNGDLQSLLRSIHPELRSVTVTADEVAPTIAPAAGVGAGFSGGVDSLSVVRTYLLEEDVPPALRLTHLLNYNVGSHGPDGTELWRARSAPLARAAAQWGVPFVRVDSNVDAHYPDIGFYESVTLRNAAVPHLLTGGISRVQVAAAQTFFHARIGTHGDIALSDTMLLPLLSTPAMTQSSANSGLSRLEKTVALIGRPEARYLDVCIASDPGPLRNCGACDKCLRAMLTLEVAGHLDDFVPTVFPREPYLARRAAYIAEILGDDQAFAVEIRDFAASRGWIWGAAAYGRAATTRVRRFGGRMLRGAARTAPGRFVRRALSV